MYRLLIETLLGVNLAGDQLRLTPRLPKNWTSYKIHYRYRQTVYHITITRLSPGRSMQQGIAGELRPGEGRLVADWADTDQLFLDGKELAVKTVPLVDDRREHFVELKVSSPVRAPENRSVLLNAV